MRAVDPYLAEFEQECASTRRLLEHVPENKLDWRPHERSMSLGELCAHVAQIPLTIPALLTAGSFDISGIRGPGPAPATKAELLALHDEGVRTGRAFLNDLDDESARSSWRITRGAEELMAMPRIGAVRYFLLNHLYHHRGQVSSYLRIAGEKVPSVYGPTADENPFD